MRMQVMVWAYQSLPCIRVVRAEAAALNGVVEEEKRGALEVALSGGEEGG